MVDRAVARLYAAIAGDSDGVVAVRGAADLATGGHEGQDHLGAGIGRARVTDSGRS